MALLALGAVLATAFVHAFWNLLVKQSDNKAAFLYFSVIISIVVFLPVAVLSTPPWVIPELLPVLAVTGVAETIYMVALTKAYEHGDLSMVYPLARGSPPLFVTIWSVLVLGDRPPFTGYLGIALIVVAIYLTTLPSLADWWKPIKSLGQVSSRWALLSGICIATYTLADRQGVRLIDPKIYNLYVYLVMALGFTPVMLLSHYRLTARLTWNANWVGIIGTGIVSITSYMIVLWALTLAPVSYVSAIRGTGVIIGAFYGWRLRHERLGAPRALGAALFALGVASLALGG